MGFAVVGGFGGRVRRLLGIELLGRRVLGVAFFVLPYGWPGVTIPCVYFWGESIMGKRPRFMLAAARNRERKGV